MQLRKIPVISVLLKSFATARTPDAARGKVFLDANRNSRHDPNETGIAGVMVSNGREVVVTRFDGSYELPAYEDMNLFITKPAGYSAPVSDEMVPQFSYIHKMAGSPDLHFGGIAPTGPLPQAINFPLIEDPSGKPVFLSCLRRPATLHPRRTGLCARYRRHAAGRT